MNVGLGYLKMLLKGKLQNERMPFSKLKVDYRITKRYFFSLHPVDWMDDTVSSHELWLIRFETNNDMSEYIRNFHFQQILHFSSCDEKYTIYSLILAWIYVALFTWHQFKDTTLENDKHKQTKIELTGGFCAVLFHRCINITKYIPQDDVISNDYWKRKKQGAMSSRSVIVLIVMMLGMCVCVLNVHIKGVWESTAFIEACIW